MDNLKNVERIKPCKSGLFTNYIFKAIPLAFDESLSYYEALCGLLYYLKYTVIPTVNNNADRLLELQSLYVELKNYVDNYFTNLDVQEEINNKLDEMAADGQLQEIIGSYLSIKSILSFDNVNSMKNSTNIINGSYAKTLGFYVINDGGEALYKIREITNTDNVNETTLISINNSNLVAELIINENMNVKQFGVKADGITDNTSKLNTILSLGKNSLYFPDGTYLINSLLTINNCIVIKGQSQNNTIIKSPNGFIRWEQNNGYRSISNITLDGVEINNNIGIQGAFAFSKICNVKLTNFSTAINSLYGSWINQFNNIFINNCTNGFIHTGSAFNNSLFINCYFQHITNYCVDIDGYNIKFLECNFESSKYCFHNASRLLEIDNSYFENNERIFNLDNSNFLDMVNVHNCWLYPTDNPQTGWLMSINTHDNVDTLTNSFIFENNWIDNIKVDTIKPFTFNSDGSSSYVGISLINNYYNNVTSSSILYYTDLFDISNCPNYATPNNPITYFTDLPIYKYEGIIWFMYTLGNIKDTKSSNNKYKMLGYHNITSTGSSSITITPPKHYGNVYPQIDDIPVTIIYDDNTIQLSTMSIDQTNFYVNVDPSKTTKKIVFNTDYYKGY